MDQVMKLSLRADALQRLVKFYSALATARLAVASESESALFKQTAHDLGLSPEEWREQIKRVEASERRATTTWASEKAEAAMAAAISAAEAEQRQHSHRLVALNDMRTLMLSKLAPLRELVESMRIAGVNDGTVAATLENLQSLTDTLHQDILRLAQRQHRMNLTHFFASNAIDEELVPQLVDAYEVR